MEKRKRNIIKQTIGNNLVDIVGESKRIIDEWFWIALTEDEFEEAIEETLRINKKIWKKISDNTNNKEYIDKRTLFDSMSVKFYTIASTKLDKKIQKIFNRVYNA